MLLVAPPKRSLYNDRQFLHTSAPAKHLTLPVVHCQRNSPRYLDDVSKDIYSRIFTSIFQAHLPNVSKPPLYIDLQAHKEGDRLTIDSAVTARLRDNFCIESLVPKYADNLKSLRGLEFDWARSDPNQDHVYANQALTHKLNEFGIVHEAEEYNGVWGTGNWGETGRIFTAALPFFQRNLIFAARRE
jgi:hypothetical protein